MARSALSQAMDDETADRIQRMQDAIETGRNVGLANNELFPCLQCVAFARMEEAVAGEARHLEQVRAMEREMAVLLRRLQEAAQMTSRRFSIGSCYFSAADPKYQATVRVREAEEHLQDLQQRQQLLQNSLATKKSQLRVLALAGEKEVSAKISKYLHGSTETTATAAAAAVAAAAVTAAALGSPHQAARASASASAS